MTYRRIVLVVLGLLLTTPLPTPACTLCSGNFKNTATLRQDVPDAQFIIYGTLANPRLLKDGGGSTELHIETVLKNDPFLKDKKVIELPRYVPFDPKKPPKYLVFCGLIGGKVDPYLGKPAKSEALVDYVKGILLLDPKDRTQQLVYFFKHLESADPDVALDAFLEFAKANDADIGQAAPKLSPEPLRRLLANPKTPPEKLSLFAFLVGACGGAKDAELLESLLKDKSDRTIEALSGLLAGYIQLQPKKGWQMTHEILRDPKRSFPERFGALGALRFYQGWKPEDSKREVRLGMGVLVGQGDIADLAIDDLRRWQIWDFTAEVLACYGKDSHKAPIVKRIIIRYALVCPKPEAAQFIAERRKQERELVENEEENLRLEKPPK